MSRLINLAKSSHNAIVLSSGSDIWSDGINMIMPWVLRAGAAVLIVGIITFALGVKDHEPDKKQQGLLMMISGGIIAATGGFAPSLLL